MQQSTVLKMEILSESFDSVVEFKIINGSIELEHLINRQILSPNPYVFIGKKLSLVQINILKSFNEKNKYKEIRKFDNSTTIFDLFSLLQDEIIAVYVGVEKFLRLSNRGKVSNFLLDGLVNEELYKDYNHDIEKNLNRFNFIKENIEQALPPIQRIIDISRYAAAMNHQIVIEWGDIN